MRVKLRILFLALLTVAAFLVVSCSGPPVSISDRIGLFITSLNTNMSTTYQNCDSGATDYSGSKDPTFWSGLFPVTPVVGTITDQSNSSAVIVSITWTAGGGPYTFAMTDNKSFLSDNWVISKITDPSSAVIFK